jgi:uncharacterized protein
MSNFSRRELLTFFGVSAATAIVSDAMGDRFLGGLGNSASAQAVPTTFTPVRTPHALPIFQAQSSFLATGLNGQGTVIPPSPNGFLATFTCIDDVVVPPEFVRYTIVSWGDRLFPDTNEYFGYNADYTGYVPINGNNVGWLWTNHEYVSYPFSPLVPEAPAGTGSLPDTFRAVIGFDLPRAAGASAAASLAALSPTDRRLFLGECYYNLGGSIVRVTKTNGLYAPSSDRSGNRRLHGLSGLGINSQRTDTYRTVTSWGTRSYQVGDQNFLIGTGAAATDVFTNVNTDGLGNRIIGTAYNCSGGTTPWGTIMTCEENFQGSTAFFIGVQEGVNANGAQTGYGTGFAGTEFGLVGEKYGWMAEIDPADPSFRPRKHTALGRFRHENATVRAEAGRRLVVYQGDDRRGGHTWKYVSNGNVTTPADKNNSRLFEAGILYAARYNVDGTGRWIPLQLSTPTDPIRPSDIASVAIANGQTTGALSLGRSNLPRRNGIAGSTTSGGFFTVERGDTENAAFVSGASGYLGRTLADFYTSQGAILVDAYPAANLVGATPTARPEDLEINPRNAREVFIAYTDGAPGSDGYPDSRIFQVAKFSSAPDAEQYYGGIYKIIEDSDDSTGTTFRWERLIQGGEAGSIQGGGFANVDNLLFDDQNNIYGVMDMTLSSINGFVNGPEPVSNVIDHSSTGTTLPDNLRGVFGNNWMFYIPVAGANAGQVVPLAIGPVRCEMTGPTFAGDTLFLSVQHPGEGDPIGAGRILNRQIEMLDLAGNLFNQTRNVPLGSNWPSNISGTSATAPRPGVIGIRRRNTSTNPNSFLG